MSSEKMCSVLQQKQRISKQICKLRSLYSHLQYNSTTFLYPKKIYKYEKHHEHNEISFSFLKENKLRIMECPSSGKMLRCQSSSRIRKKKSARKIKSSFIYKTNKNYVVIKTRQGTTKIME